MITKADIVDDIFIMQENGQKGRVSSSLFLKTSWKHPC